MRPGKQVLLLCKDPFRASMLRFVMDNQGFRVSSAETLAEAVLWIRAHEVDAVVLCGMGENAIGSITNALGATRVVWLMPVRTLEPSKVAGVSIRHTEFKFGSFLERLRVMCVRPRGPRRQRPLAAPVAEKEETLC